MSKRFGRRQKAKLKAELASTETELKNSIYRERKSQSTIDNAPHTYKLAAEICQIAKNINLDFDILQPRSRERMNQISITENICSTTAWDHEKHSLSEPMKYDAINLNAAQVFYDIEEILDQFGNFRKMKVFTFKYGNDRACLQMSEDELKYSSHQAIVDQLVHHMKSGLSMYNGEKG